MRFQQFFFVFFIFLTSLLLINGQRPGKALVHLYKKLVFMSVCVHAPVSMIVIMFENHLGVLEGVGVRV